MVLASASAPRENVLWWRDVAIVHVDGRQGRERPALELGQLATDERNHVVQLLALEVEVAGDVAPGEVPRPRIPRHSRRGQRCVRQCLDIKKASDAGLCYWKCHTQYPVRWLRNCLLITA